MSAWRVSVVAGLVFALAVLTSCRSDFKGEETEAADPVETCMSCESQECTTAAETCAANPDCAECVSAPFGLECYGQEDFRRLASCSCAECSGECDYMCPGGFNACETCAISQCATEAAPCTGDVECAGCFSDPLGEGCQENPDFQEFLECGCEQCGQECIWTCPDAYSACNLCGIGSCGEEFSACLGDPECAACAENPLLEGCRENEIALAALGCGCEHCEEQCGVLYTCDELP